MENVNIKMAINELHKGFKFLNDKYYEGQLPEPAILIQSNGNRKYVMGWCTRKEIWKNTDSQESRYEINIVAEYLNQGLVQIMQILHHEMIHLYHNVNEIQGVSRAGTYHNKTFKADAEKRDLQVESDKKNGHAYTSATPAFTEFIESLDLEEAPFSLVRLDPITMKSATGATSEGEGEGSEGEEKPEEKKKKSFRRYVCPSCGNIIRATKEVNCICGDCNVKYEEQEK